MPKVPVYNLKNEQVGEIELDGAIFDAPVKMHILHEVVRWQLAKRRRGTHSAKTRAEVSYSTRKLFRQKGTGRARRGSRKSPILVGGGVSLAPKPRNYEFSVPKKVRKAALRGALSLHFKDGSARVVENFDLSEVKTKRVAEVLKAFGMGSALIIDAKDNDKLYLSARNIKGVDFLPPEGLNVYDLLNHEGLIVTKQALEHINGALKK